MKKNIIVIILTIFFSINCKIESIALKKISKKVLNSAKGGIDKSLNKYTTRDYIILKELAFQATTPKDELLKYVSYHEAAHALVGYKLGFKIDYIYASTVKLSGLTRFISVDEKNLSNSEKETLYKKYISVFFAGEIVTSIIFGNKYGCSGDNTYEKYFSSEIIDNANPIVKKYKEATQTLTDREKRVLKDLFLKYTTPFVLNEAYKTIRTQPILDECYKNAERIIQENIQTLHVLAKAIINSETKHGHIKINIPNGSWKFLDGSEVEKIIDGC